MRVWNYFHPDTDHPDEDGAQVETRDGIPVAVYSDTGSYLHRMYPGAWVCEGPYVRAVHPREMVDTLTRLGYRGTLMDPDGN